MNYNRYNVGSKMMDLSPKQPQPLRPSGPICEQTDLCKLKTFSHTSGSITANSIKITDKLSGTPPIDLLDTINGFGSNISTLFMEIDSLKRNLSEVQLLNDQRSAQQMNQFQQQQQKNQELSGQIQALNQSVRSIRSELDNTVQQTVELRNGINQIKSQIITLSEKDNIQSANIINLQENVRELYQVYNTQQAAIGRLDNRLTTLERR